ncbi:hypothetical protein [Sphingomonas sp. LHG3443-2]|uniref:hypothetical protein n=1 Tax=Sphingomonas sp. LHG3443-2 TaxID=2804639 RepID=UPI003CF87EA4
MQEQAYRKYILKTWPRSHLWQCRADLDGREVGEREVADDADDALAAMKAKLDARDATITEGRGKDGCPSALEYAEAFARVKMSPGHEAMLKAHLDAPDHCLTATELAAAAGYANWSAANLQYGLLGQAVAVDLSFNPRTRDDGTTIWTTALADSAGRLNDDVDSASLHRSMERREEDQHFEWTLRPQVVEALRGRR